MEIPRRGSQAAVFANVLNDEAFVLQVYKLQMWVGILTFRVLYAKR